MGDTISRKLAVILHADVVGSTTLVQLNETLAHERIHDTFQRFSETIRSYNGTPHEIRGDALLAEFSRASDSVSASLAFQNVNTKLNAELPGDVRPVIRVGIAMGEVVVADNTITGEGVVLAQRLEQLAQPGGICIQDAAYQTVPKRLPFGYENLGKHELKGFEEPVRVYAVSLSAGATIPDPENLIQDDDSVLKLPDKPSVAVLPFENLNRDPNEDYLSDGITEDITTALSKYRWLTVIARNPAFSFRNSTDSLRVIGKKLNAGYIVTGSVRKAGSRARISVQVVDADTEHSVWVERFDRDIEDIFDLQDEITELVASRIESELGLSEQRKAARRPRKNLGAWDLYQLGVAEFNKFTREANLTAQDLLRQSIKHDPELARAHSRLAYAIVLGMVYFDAAPNRGAMDEALTAAKRAIELDDMDANSFFTIGRVHLARREYDLAIDALEHAVELNPSLAVTYCGLGDSLAYEGRLDEAIEKFEIAIRLSPHDPFRWAFFSYRSLAHLFRGDYEDAVSWARKAIQIPNASYWAGAHLVAALGHLGDEKRTQNAVNDLMKKKPEFSLDFARKHLFYLKLTDQIETYLGGLKKAGVN